MLFRDERVFSPEYVPDSFLYREAQMAALQYCLKPVMRGQKPVNAYLVGKPATGKTTALRIALEQLSDASDAVCVHLNCASVTPYRIFAEMHKAAVGFLPPETGVPLSKVQDAVFRKVAKEKRPLVVALDDVHDILAMEEPLYALLRAHESYPAVKVGVLIASTRHDAHKLDDRTRSSLGAEVVNFAPYSKDQLAAILQERAARGLMPGVAPPAVIQKIAGESPDARSAIETLRAAALKAEAEGKKSISPAHLSIRHFEQERTGEEQLILAALRKGPADSGSLHERIGRKLSYSKLYRTLRRLEADGTVAIKEIQKGKGKSRLISLKA